MKRKITKLEQTLIDNGYRLSHKQYGGRKSEKTLSYYYVKLNPQIKHNQFVRLDYKRENILSLGILNYTCQELTRFELDGLKVLIESIENDTTTYEPKVIKVYQQTENDGTEEIVEYIKSMTPEQFDEMCKEKE